MSDLDLYSTSQTDLGFKEKSKAKFEYEGCHYHAPFFAIEKIKGSRVWSLSQGSCNHWDCPRCGVIRAKEEYWRIVNGCEQIVSEGHEMYFVTITTRGAGLKVAEAEENYLQWTNRLLTNLRTYTSRHNGYWCYVQVTERQKRKHPHSHILTTFKPLDLTDGKVKKYEQVNGKKQARYEEALRSDFLQKGVRSAGLGEQYDISKVRDVSAVSRYVAKYLFKSALHTVWPDGWKRVRYSHNWPKASEPNSEALVLLKREDWQGLAQRADKLLTTNEEAFVIAGNYLWSFPVELVLK